MKTLAQILIFVILLFSASLIWASDKKLSFIGVEKQETVAATETPSYSQNVKKVQANAALDKVSGLQLMTEDQLDAYVARHMSDATPRQRRQFKNKWLAKAKSNELAAAAQRQELDEKSNSKWELSDNTKDYLHRSGQQVLYGNYTDECTALGTAGEIALACTGLDAPGDIRDLSHDLRNPEPSLTWLGKTALDGASLLPLVGVLKHAGKVRKCAIKALKNGDKTCKITRQVAKHRGALASLASKTKKALKKPARNVIGYARGAGKSAFTPDRLQHASDHLRKAGLLPNWSTATGKKFTELGSNILENPTATFDHVLRGGHKVKGFVGSFNGKKVAIMVYKEGDKVGKVATAVVPYPSQIKKWGI